MAQEPDAVLQDLRAAIARLNETLEAAQAAEISVEVSVHQQRFVGRLSPLVVVSGQASKSKVEFVERL